MKSDSFQRKGDHSGGTVKFPDIFPVVLPTSSVLYIVNITSTLQTSVQNAQNYKVLQKRATEGLKAS